MIIYIMNTITLQEKYADVHSLMNLQKKKKKTQPNFISCNNVWKKIIILINFTFILNIIFCMYFGNLCVFLYCISKHALTEILFKFDC